MLQVKHLGLLQGPYVTAAEQWEETVLKVEDEYHLLVYSATVWRVGFEMRRRESSADVGEEKWSQGQTRQLEVCHYCRRVRPAILPILKLILKFFGRSHRPLLGSFGTRCTTRTRTRTV